MREIGAAGLIEEEQDPEAQSQDIARAERFIVPFETLGIADNVALIEAPVDRGGIIRLLVRLARRLKVATIGAITEISVTALFRRFVINGIIVFACGRSGSAAREEIEEIADAVAIGSGKTVRASCARPPADRPRLDKFLIAERDRGFDLDRKSVV